MAGRGRIFASSCSFLSHTHTPIVAGREMKVNCPKCETLIPAPQMNVAVDVAACPTCSEVFSLSSLVMTQEVPAEFDIHDPPSGAWFDEDFRGWRIGASTRSPAAFFLVPFMCVWSGFSLGGIYGTQIAKGEFNLGMSLFGIPFVLGTILFGAFAVMTVCGRVDVMVDDSDGRLFAGVGPFGWTRRFDWSKVTKIEDDLVRYDDSSNSGHVISIVGQTRLKLGGIVNEERQYYLLQGLRVLRQRA